MTKTLVQCPTGSGPDTAFLARQWELMRPDVLFLLDDADPNVSNKFIRGWMTSTVTLDPTKPTVDAGVVEEGAWYRSRPASRRSRTSTSRATRSCRRPT